MLDPKVFVIGFHKTGTSSMAQALRLLGYTVTGPDFVYHSNLDSEILNLAFERAQFFDAFQDSPWFMLYKEMDERYPGSKFILTIRPAQAWIKSMKKHFWSSSTPMRKWIYAGRGTPQGNEEYYIARYEQHNQDVQEYFLNRPQELLIMRIGRDGWPELCQFLGREIPDKQFPHQNASTFVRKLRRFLRNKLRLPV